MNNFLKKHYYCHALLFGSKISWIFFHLISQVGYDLILAMCICQVRIAPRFHENICMRQSALISSAVSSIQKDLLSQPLQLLSGVDILGNASSALGHMSKGMAALSMDKKFIQSRQKQVLQCLNV